MKIRNTVCLPTSLTLHFVFYESFTSLQGYIKKLCFQRNPVQSEPILEPGLLSAISAPPEQELTKGLQLEKEKTVHGSEGKKGTASSNTDQGIANCTTNSSFASTLICEIAL